MPTIGEELQIGSNREQTIDQFTALPYSAQMLLACIHGLVDRLDQLKRHKESSSPHQDVYIRQLLGDHLPKEILALRSILVLISRDLFSNHQTLAELNLDCAESLEKEGIFIYWQGLANTAEWLHSNSWRSYNPFVDWITENFPRFETSDLKEKNMTHLIELAYGSIDEADKEMQSTGKAFP